MSSQENHQVPDAGDDEPIVIDKPVPVPEPAEESSCESHSLFGLQLPDGVHSRGGT